MWPPWRPKMRSMPRALRKRAIQAAVVVSSALRSMAVVISPIAYHAVSGVGQELARIVNQLRAKLLVFSPQCREVGAVSAHGRKHFFTCCLHPFDNIVIRYFSYPRNSEHQLAHGAG